MKISIHSVQTRLLGAFALVAAMTVAAAIAGFVAFSGARGALGGVVDEAVPLASAANELDAASSSITGELAAFSRSTDTVDMAASQSRLNTLLREASESVDALAEAGLEAERVDELRGLVEELTGSVAAANAPTEAALAASDQRTSNVRAAIGERAALAADLEASLDETEDAADIETLLRAIMAVNLIVTQYAELETVDTEAAIASIEEQYQFAADELSVNLAIMGDAIDAGIGEQAQTLLAHGPGEDGVFAARRAEIAATEEASLAVEDARFAHADLARSVGEVVEAAEAQAETARANGYGAVAFGQTLLTVISVLAVIVAALVGWLYVSRNLLTRLNRISTAMTALASGDTSRDISDTGRDEIAEMARAAAVFRENAIERARLESESEAERQAREARAKKIEELVQGFEEASSRALGAVTDAARDMEMAAGALTESSQGASSRTAEVNEAGVVAAQNVDTVASAAEEMTSSISEIAQQIERSSDIAQSAASQVKDANGDVTALSEAAGKIDGVVRLINDIAEQTNLLALNATIEAARAGEAGKGFAVVASEVKSLAEQTAKATGSISEQIGGIQSATGKAVDAIGSIGKVIAEMNEISTAIAAAMEEQRAAAAEITRSAQDAAGGTKKVSDSIQAVDQAASETGQCAAQVNQASHTLNTEASGLKEAVSRFLQGVRAA